MTGTENQVEWAGRIKRNVEAKFARVEDSFRRVAETQSEMDGADTATILGILAVVRSRVLAHDEAGYYIRNWQEIGDQVRTLIAQDPLYRSIRAERKVKQNAI